MRNRQLVHRWMAGLGLLRLSCSSVAFTGLRPRQTGWGMRGDSLIRAQELHKWLDISYSWEALPDRFSQETPVRLLLSSHFGQTHCRSARRIANGPDVSNHDVQSRHFCRVLQCFAKRQFCELGSAVRRIRRHRSDEQTAWLRPTPHSRCFSFHLGQV